VFICALCVKGSFSCSSSSSHYIESEKNNNKDIEKLKKVDNFVEEKMKYVLVTGGVVSGLGKGVTASSIGLLLKACGLRVTAIKIGTTFCIFPLFFFFCCLFNKNNTYPFVYLFKVSNFEGFYLFLIQIL
jgi:hypothetical protein